MPRWLVALWLAWCVCAVRAHLPVVSDFAQYSESHAVRAYRYEEATNCQPYSTFVHDWLAVGGYPHVPAVAPDANTTAISAATFSTHVSASGVEDGIFGIVVADPADDAILVAVRGAKSIDNWIQIIQYSPKDVELCPPNTVTNSSSCVKFQAHTGFWAGFLDARKQVESLVAAALSAHPAGLIHVIGHSLGAALAVLFGADLAIAYPGNFGSLYAYGQPRVASQALFTYLEAQHINYFRIVNQMDAVPHLPEVKGLVHGGTEVWYPDGATAGNPYQVCPPPWVEGRNCSEAPFKAKCASALLCFGIYESHHLAYFGGNCVDCAAVPSAKCDSPA